MLYIAAFPNMHQNNKDSKDSMEKLTFVNFWKIALCAHNCSKIIINNKENSKSLAALRIEPNPPDQKVHVLTAALRELSYLN